MRQGGGGVNGASDHGNTQLGLEPLYQSTALLGMTAVCIPVIKYSAQVEAGT